MALEIFKLVTQDNKLVCKGVLHQHQYNECKCLIHHLQGKNLHSNNYNYDCVYIIVAVGSSGILKGKQKLGVTFSSNKLGVIDFTKISKLTMCSA